MICKGCTEGKHCGKPGKASASCPCQHRRPGAWKGVRTEEKKEKGS